MTPRQALLTAVLGAAAVPGAPVGVEGIPDRALVAYVQAAAGAPCAIPWWDLAAVGAVESGHGTHGGAHLQNDGTMTVAAVSSASARGPMQFVRPTWDAYGDGGNIDDIDDAAPATARLLCADGYERDRMESFEAYNGGGYRGPATDAYAAAVDRFAQAYQKADNRSLPATKVDKSRTPGRLWDRLVARWMTVGESADRVGLGGAWRWADDGMFGASAQPVESASGSRIEAAARGWVGRDFNPGEREQCAVFVRRVLADAGVELSPDVTAETLDGWWTGRAIANSFGADQGDVIRNVGDLRAGDVVMFANTYGDWPDGAITHVGVYVGGGMIVDRPTAAQPVQLRSLSTFSTFAGGVRVRDVSVA